MKKAVVLAKRFCPPGVALKLLPLLGLLLGGCASQSRWATRVEWKELGLEKVPSREDYPDAEAVVLLDEGRMELLSGGDLQLSIFERHRVVKILKPGGLRYANVVIAYDPGNEIEAIRARTISPDGKITVLSEEDIYDVNLYPEYIWYSDQRAKIFAFPAVQVGSIVEYQYRMNIRHLTFWHSWYFQETVPVRLSRFTLIGPSEWEVNYRTYGMDIEPHVVKAPKGFKSRYVWEMRDVPALKSEFSMPPVKERAVHLTIAPAGVKTWDDVARWYHDLAAPQMKCSDSMKVLARSLTAGVKSKREQLRRLYEWVRDRVRYVAIEIGIGGYRPHPARQVFERMYGDCKDMATLLCALAREVGIEANQVIVSTWQNGRPDTSLPSQLQFNHVIAYSPELDVWMDPTEKGCPFGKLPWYDQGLPVLVVNEDGSAQIAMTPRDPADSNRTEVEWRVDLGPDGGARVRGEIRLYGAPATETREELFYLSDRQLRTWLETMLAAQVSGAELDSFSVTGVSEVQDPVRIRFGFATDAFTQRRGDRRSFRPAEIVGFDLPTYFRPLRRIHPVRFRFGLLTKASITVNYPRFWTLLTPAWRDSVVSPYGDARWLVQSEGNQVRVELRYRISATEVPAEEYPDFRDFLEQIRLGDLLEVAFSTRPADRETIDRADD